MFNDYSSGTLVLRAAVRRLLFNGHSSDRLSGAVRLVLVFVFGFVLLGQGYGQPPSNALNFDGSDDGISVPDNNLLDLNTSFTLEAWININAYQPTSPPQFGNSGIIAKNRDAAGGTGYALAVTDGKLSLLANNNANNFALTTTNNLPLNTWLHVAAVRNGTSAKLFIDGVEVRSGTISFNLLNSSQPFNVGHFGDSGGSSTWKFNGTIDDVRIWNTPRSAAEIVASKDCELEGNESGLVAYYKLNQGTASGSNAGLITATDATTNALNGTLNGFALNGSTSNWVAGQVTTSCAALPVELISFTGRATEAGNLLQWITATEENNEGFQVQRSSDGRDFQTIGWVAGAGTTLATQQYEYRDDQPLTGLNYYRLQQVDYDGTTDYSEVITVVRASKTNGIVAYPNPVSDLLTLENAQGTATLFNALGQPIKQFNILHTPFQVDLSDLPRGTYHLQLMGQDGATHSLPILK